MCCKQPLHAFAREFSEKGGGRIRQRGLFALKCWCHANTAQRFSPNREMWSSTFTDPAGRPSFNALQNYGSSATPLVYYVFDVLILAGEDVTSEQLVRRRALLQARVLSKLDEPIRESPILDASLPILIRSVKAQGLEGIVAKRLDSRYEPGLRSECGRRCVSTRGSSS